ncbi:MAG: hypothetical protein IT359_11475 [Gemmatimonadaceae bacterium]|nr:hypothetical protein [Gemmatimonadaceae bacterium]
MSIAVCMQPACAHHRGGWVVKVDSGSVAWDAGLREGDTVLTVNRVPLSKATAARVLRFEADQAVALEVRRGTKAILISGRARKRT